MENNIEVPNVVDVEWAKEEMERTGKKKCNKDFVWYIQRNNGDIDWVDLSTLPKGERNAKPCVEWKEVLSNNIYIGYSNRVLEVELNYSHMNKNHKRYVDIKFEDSIDCIATSGIQKLSFGNLLGYKSSNYKYSVGEVTPNNHRIIEQKRVRNRKGYKVQCLLTEVVYDINEYDLLKITSSKYACNQEVYKGNSFNTVYPDMTKYLINPKEGDLNTYGSGSRVKVKCPHCNYTKETYFYVLGESGMGCPLCKDYMSFPERLAYEYFKLKGIEFIHQYPLQGKRVDFVMEYEGKQTFTEINGRQHYENHGWHDSHIHTKASDRFKREYCKKNNINLVEIDASNSNFHFIYNNLGKVFGYLSKGEENELKVKLRQREDKLASVVVSMYKEGYTWGAIERETGKNHGYLTRVLHNQGLIGKRERLNKKKVKCVTTGKEFNSIKEAVSYYNLPKTCKIGMVCRGQRDYAGNIEGVKLQWEYIEEKSKRVN